MPLRGQVTPPGNKNTAMPAVVAAALSSAGAEIRNVPNIADIRELWAILTSIGLDVTLTNNVLTTRPRQPTASVIPNQLSCKLRGSVYALAILARFFSQSE